MQIVDRILTYRFGNNWAGQAISLAVIAIIITPFALSFAWRAIFHLAVKIDEGWKWRDDLRAAWEITRDELWGLK